LDQKKKKKKRPATVSHFIFLFFLSCRANFKNPLLLLRSFSFSTCFRLFLFAH